MPQSQPRYAHSGTAQTPDRAQRRQQAVLDAQADVARPGLPRREIMQRVCSRAFDGFDATLVAVARPVGSALVFDVGAGHTPTEPVMVQIATSLTGLCFRTREPFRTGDVTRDPRSSLMPIHAFASRSVMLAPILGPDEPFGVLMATSEKADAFDPQDLQMFEVLANVIAGGILASNSVVEKQVLVAQRTQALSEFQRVEALLRVLTESSNEWICILRENGSIRYSSPSVTRILGFTPAELEGRRPVDLVHPDDRPTMLATYAALGASSGQPHGMLVRMQHKDRGWRYLEGTGRNLLHQPSVAGIVCTARDVTARIAADRSLEFQAKLLQTVEQAIISTDLTGIVTYWSAGAEKLYGWSSNEVIGQGLRDLLVSPDLAARADETMTELRAGRSWSGEFEVLRRDGTSFLAAVTDTPIFDGAGQLLGFVGVSSDVTVRRELELQLRQAQKMEAVGQLAGGVAHDFNNILTAIIGYSELALQKLPEGSLRDDVTEIRVAGERAADLTRQLLTFSRKQVLRVETVDLKQVVSGLDKMLRRVVHENIVMDTSLAQQPVHVEADRSQLEQMLLNLVVNARDAMPKGGRLTVSVTRETDGYGSLVAVLRVIDTGCGMNDDVKRRIFEPFFTTKPEGNGTGLGLAVVFGVVQQLAGSITVDSEPEKGTTFTIALPLSSAVPLPQTRYAEDLPQGTETVLLVEDNEPLSVMTTRFLQSLGYRVVRAGNGGAASRLPPTTLASVDVVLADVVMPEMNGPDLVRELRARHFNPAVVYTSGYTQGADLGMETDMRSAGFIPKPWTSKELAVEVRRALDARNVKAA